MSNLDQFPHPVYADTVLEPLFEGVKTQFAPHIRAINEAHLVMLHHTGILTSQQSGPIARALHEISQETDISALTYTGEYEDYFFLVEAELKARVGADLGGMLHTARSRNDMDHTVFKMALRARVDALLNEGEALASAILTKAKVEKATPIVAYTHGQPAQASTFGHYLCAALEVLLSDIKRLLDARHALDLCPMGAAAITTSGFPIDRHMMAGLLGFSEPKRNSYGCIASVDYITGVYSAIKLLVLHLGRLVQDFQFWTAFEVGQLWMPGSLVQISSIMPQKRNPVPIEHLRLLLSLTNGRCDMMVNTMHNTPFTDMNDSEGEVQQAGYAAFDSGSRALRLLASVIEAVTIRVDRVGAISDAACVTITELADSLVREEGVSFRQAHHVAAETAKAVISSGSGLAAGYTSFCMSFKQEIGHAPTLSEASYLESVSMEAFINRRNRFGGPAPSALDEAFESYRQTLDELRTNIARGPSRITESEEKRRTDFAALTEI